MYVTVRVPRQNCASARRRSEGYGPYYPYGRRGFSGLGWTGGFTLPGDTTRYSTETCTGSAAQPMTGGNLVCGMPAEIDYLQRIGCTAVGFRGQHYCSTDAGNQGLFYCCPQGVLQQELEGRGGEQPASMIPGLPGGITTNQIIGLVGVAGVIGALAYFMSRKPAKVAAMEEAPFEFEE